MSTTTPVVRLVRLAVLGSLAFVLMYFVEFGLPIFADFLKYDPGDVPAMIATYTMGIGAGLVVELIKVLLYWVSGKSTAGLIGVVANLLAGGALVVGTGLVHRWLGRTGHESLGARVLSAAAGAVVMALVLIPVLAVLVYPLWGMSGAAAWQAALYLSTPFNLFKGFVSTVVALAFYRRVAHAGA